MKLNFLQVVVLLLLAFSPLSNAAIVDDLYTIKLPVENQTTQLRLDTFRKAFAEVLVKISGAPKLLNDPALQRSLRSSTRYVKEFRYERQEVSEDDVEESQIILSVEFSQNLVEALLRGKGYPVWGRVRPSVLIVMSKQINKSHELVSEESAPELIEYMDKLSRKHGLPTQFPLLDLEDRAVLNFKESALDNLNAINDLGFRYQSDVVLVGELIGISGQGWKGIWQSQFSGQLFQWEHKASTKEVVMEKAMSHLARILAQEYALGSIKENINSVVINVSNVTTLESYLTVARYFSSLAVVEKTQVKLLSANSVSFSLTLRNSPDELQHLIELGDVIEQVDLPVIDTTVEILEEGVAQDALSLTYRFLLF